MLLSAWQTSRNASKRDLAAHTHELQMAQKTRPAGSAGRAYNNLGMFLSWQAE